MRRRLVVLVSLALLALSVGVAVAQFGPDVAGDPATLARSGSGVATTAGASTSAMNPAALPMLYRVPPELPGAVEDMAEAPPRELPPAYAAAAQQWRRGWVATSPTDDPWDFSFAGARDGDRLALAAGGGAMGLPGLAIGDVRGAQINIETRFVTIEQDFLRGLGVDLPTGTGMGQFGYTGDFSDDGDVNSFDVTWGGLGDDSAWGAGWAKLFDQRFVWLSYGQMLHQASSFTDPSLSLGATVAHSDLGADDSGVSLDLGVLSNRGVNILGRPALVGGGLVVRNVFDQFGDFDQLGRRVDLGVVGSTPHVRVTLDLRDVFDDTALPYVGNTGRQVRTSLEVRAGNTIVIGGLAEQEKPTWGVSQQVPILGKVPVLSVMFAKSEFEERVGLMVMITPRIIDRE